MNLSTHPVWHQLQAHAQRCLQQLDLRQALQAPGRFARLSLQAPHVRLDCSKGLWDEAVLHDLLQLAQAAELPQRRAALLAGQMVNPTEGRPALHAALRAPFAPVPPHGLQHPVARCPDVEAGMHTMLALAEQLHAQGRFTDVLHLGIGGSSLGPELALQALQPWCQGGPRVQVVSNMDGHDLHQALQGLVPSRTLVVVASKSWTTAETQRNMASVLAWLQADPAVHWPDHCVAITARPAAALQPCQNRRHIALRRWRTLLKQELAALWLPLFQRGGPYPEAPEGLIDATLLAFPHLASLRMAEALLVRQEQRWQDLLGSP